MVAFTCNDTLSLLITSWRPPVRGVSRMSTSSITSAKGSRNVIPGLRTAWNWPSRFTTPTEPCWMTRIVRAITRTARTMIRRTMISPSKPLFISLLSSALRRTRGDSLRTVTRRDLHPVDQERGLVDLRHADDRTRLDGQAVSAERRPVLSRDAYVTTVVRSDGVDDDRLLADHRVGAGERLRPVPCL